MADVETQATLSVDIKGLSGLQRLQAALNQMKKLEGGARPAAVSPARSQQQAQNIAVRAAQSIGRAMVYTLRAPFDALRATGQVLGKSVLSLSGSFGQIAGKAGLISVSLIAFGAAIGGLALPIINLVGGFKILKEAFGWAQSAADEQIKIAGRARRFFPQLLGEGIEAAEETMRERMATMGALFGGAADSMQEQITRRITDYRMGHGLRGDKDIFARWGISPESTARYEEMTGSKVDLTTFLRLFVLKRQDLERRLGEAKSPQERRILRAKLAYIADDSVKIFGQKFSDVMLTMEDKDLAKLQGNMRAAVSLGKYKDATRRSIDFTIAFESLKATFSAITIGIGGDVQPVLTQFLNSIRLKLIDVKEGGSGLGQAFRELASSMASKTWETLKSVLDELKPERIIGWIAEVKSWKPKETADTIKGFFNAVISFGRSIGWLIKKVSQMLGLTEPEQPAGAAAGGAAAGAAAGGGAPVSAGGGGPAPGAAPIMKAAPTAPAPGAAPAPPASTAPAAPSASSPPNSQPATQSPVRTMEQWGKELGVGARPAVPTAPAQLGKQSSLNAFKTAAAGGALVTSADIKSTPSGDWLTLKSSAKGTETGRTSAGPLTANFGGFSPPPVGGAGAPFSATNFGLGGAGAGAFPPLAGQPGQPGQAGLPGADLFAPPPLTFGFGTSSLTSRDGAAFGAAAAESLKGGLDGVSIGGPAPTSYGVAPRAAPKPTGGDTASES